MLLYGEWVEENVLEPVPHRQYVFTLPKLLRPVFGRHRTWLGELIRVSYGASSSTWDDGRPKHPSEARLRRCRPCRAQDVLNQFDAMPTMRDSLPDTLKAMLTGLWEQLETPATGGQKPPAQGGRT